MPCERTADVDMFGLFCSLSTLASYRLIGATLTRLSCALFVTGALFPQCSFATPRVHDALSFLHGSGASEQVRLTAAEQSKLCCALKDGSVVITILYDLSAKRFGMSFTKIYLACLLVCFGYGVSFSLYSLLLDATDVSGAWIGVNAALPAIGWILGSLAVPVLQLRLKLHIKWIALSFLFVAGIGAVAMIFSNEYLGLSVARFLFGGALGVFLRCVEYILVANAPTEKRGRYLAIYAAAFLIGIAAGATIQPAIGGGTSGNLTAIIASLVVGGVTFSRTQIPDGVWDAPNLDVSVLSFVPMLPIAFMGVFAYSLYESVPAYFLQIFALKNGTGEAVAVSTLSAAALGNLFLLLPILAISDRLGRNTLLAFCATVAAIVPFSIMMTVGNHTLLLLLVAVLGAAAGASYALSLAMLGDRFGGQALVMANACFGVIYAAGSVVGPLLHGFAMEISDPAGLMHSVSGIFVSLILGITIAAASSQFRSKNV